ncbi:hypothetical protein ACQJBY_061885 [Aegilops geniculata]
MVSWKDSETSSDESVSPLFKSHAEETYIPQTIVDPEWCGIVAGGPLCCHNAPVQRAVVFQGINTGRRFYGCGNEEGDTCGLVQWIDPEWPEPMRNALRKLWDMYEQSSKENAAKEKLILKLAEEKKLIQEKHHNHIKETSNFFATIHKNVMRENYQKIMQDGDVENAVLQAQEEMAKLEKDNNELRTALQVIKQSNDELVSNWKKHVADEGLEQIEQMKKEKKKLEYIIADLLKDGEANKVKLRKIKELCDE